MGQRGIETPTGKIFLLIILGALVDFSFLSVLSFPEHWRLLKGQHPNNKTLWLLLLTLDFMRFSLTSYTTQPLTNSWGSPAAENRPRMEEKPPRWKKEADRPHLGRNVWPWNWGWEDWGPWPTNRRCAMGHSAVTKHTTDGGDRAVHERAAETPRDVLMKLSENDDIKT